MKKSLLGVFLTVIVSLVSLTGFAQEQNKVEDGMKAIVEKYDSIEGFDCMTVVKGEGLELVKAAFNKQFGKKFMKGVTSMTIMTYTDASQEACVALQKDLTTVLSLMKEFDTKGADTSKEFKSTKFYAIEEDEKVLSDCIFLFEGEDTKMLLYMAGKINCN